MHLISVENVLKKYFLKKFKGKWALLFRNVSQET